VVTTRDAVEGPVGIGEAEVDTGVGVTLLGTHVDAVTAAQEVVLGQRGAIDHPGTLRVTQACRNRARRLLFDVVGHIQLVRFTRNRLGLYLDLLEETEALEALTRLGDRFGGGRSTFHLDQLTT